MNSREARFKKLGDDAKVLGIGTLFRAVGNKSWAINVDFNGGNSQSMQFSNIPVIARKRVLNATKPYESAGLPLNFKIDSTKNWEICQASDSPAYRAHRHGKDESQLCFMASISGRNVCIPQLEFARVLFFHDPFLARLSLQHNALAEDFMIGKRNDGQPVITVREGVEYPLFYFNSDNNRRFLSWVLLDAEARQSFESISRYLVRNQYLQNNYQKWKFQFTPPSLSNVDVTVRGWEDRETSSFFVWSVSRLGDLPSDVTGEIDFCHPGFKRQVGGKPTRGDNSQSEAPEYYELDDDELSDSDKCTMAIDSDRVEVSFRTPHITNRVPTKIQPVNTIIGDSSEEVLDKELSPNEKVDVGNLPSGVWNNLDDITDDVHLYLGRFESFFKMVDCLLEVHQCRLVNKDILKLPKVGDGKKHWLADSQNPRCVAFVELLFENQSYCLLEVDTSDGAAKLSTMLLKSSIGWLEDNQQTILLKVMKKSLGWPSELFLKKLGDDSFAAIPHPKSKHSGSLPPEIIEPWAQRVANWIKRS